MQRTIMRVMASSISAGRSQLGCHVGTRQISQGVTPRHQVTEYVKDLTGDPKQVSIEEIRKIIGSSAVTLKRSQGDLYSLKASSSFTTFYSALDLDAKFNFLKILSEEFNVKSDDLKQASLDFVATVQNKGDDPRAIHRAVEKLRKTSAPLYDSLFSVINQQPYGMKFLVDLRADVLNLIKTHPGSFFLNSLDDNLRAQLQNWFSVGFVQLKEVSWDSPASLLEKIVKYEAVHPIPDWVALRQRLVGPSRRCFGFFHQSMQDEPLVFVQVALVDSVSDSIQGILKAPSPPKSEPFAPSTAIFYSISSTQAGLTGIDLGNFLIKQVVSKLKKEVPSLVTFSTLSPMPGFLKWLLTKMEITEQLRNFASDPIFTAEEQTLIKKLSPGSDTMAKALRTILEKPDWHLNPEVAQVLEKPLMRNGAIYLWKEKKRFRAIDPVCNFHIRNGATLWRLNWLGDTSSKGLKQSAGLMVNYRYEEDLIEKNNLQYLKDGTIALSPQVLQLLSR